MAYPASQVMLKEALNTIDGIALRSQKQVQNLRARTAAGPVAINEFKLLAAQLAQGVVEWDRVVAGVNTAALVAYAKDEKGDQALDIVAEYQAMKSAAVALSNWITANVPNDTLTTAQTAIFRTNADTFLATIS